MNRRQRIENLGMVYSPEKTIFRVWAPTQEEVNLCLYQHWQSLLREEYPMTKDSQGVFEVIVEGNLDGTFYTYLIEGKEVTDPYSIAASMNSQRSAVVDLASTNPEGWLEHRIPKHSNKIPIIYELHIKDYTVHETSGVRYPGKYLGLAETNTDYQGFKTGLSHLSDLGVTHVQLLPIFDFLTSDEHPENFYKDNNYNWGYDPELYNVPEGSYSLDSRMSKQRIYELKKMIQALHEAGLSVVMDVVYNHTYRSKDSNFQIIVPNYYYRLSDKGFCDGSGCGNEIASERFMAQQFILDSLKYWMEEYKIDGFRFDLFGLMDTDTMKIIHKELKEVNPNVILYGEPWTGGDSPLPWDMRGVKGSQKGMRFGMFNDTFRDAIKGDNDGYGKGFVQGDFSCKLDVETGIAGSIHYDKRHIGFTENAIETINYVNSHDNMILFDKLEKTLDGDPYFEQRYFMAFAIILTSFGIPFIHEGNEFMRSKQGLRNSYNAPISVNAVDWSLRSTYQDMVEDFKELIQLRKELGVFDITDGKKIREILHFIPGLKDSCIGYEIQLNDKESILIFHHGDQSPMHLTLQDLQKMAIKPFEKAYLIWDKAQRKERIIEDEVILEAVETVIIKTQAGEVRI